MIGRVLVGGALAISLALIVSATTPGVSLAACGQDWSTCQADRMCFYSGDNYSGAIEQIQCSNANLSFNGCGSSCDCLCFGNLAKSVFNNTGSLFRLFAGTSYTGASLDVLPGVALTGGQMGSLYANAESAKNLDPVCPPCCG